MRRLLGVAFLSALATGGAFAQGWTSYHNTRFGVTADVPAGWKMNPPPENNDGRLFVSPDGQAQITVSGMFALSSAEEEIADRLKPESGRTQTFVKRGPRWVVVSGLKGDRIYYTKAVLSCADQVWNDLWIEYPAADKAKYDAIVTHVAASLRPGKGYDSQTCK